MTDPLVTIPLCDLRAVLPFMATKDVRHYLNGLSVEPYNGGCLLVATNGHIMAVMESKAARCDVPRILALSTDEFRAAIRGRIAPFFRLDDDEDQVDEGDENFDGTLEVADADEHSRAVIRATFGAERFILPGKPFIDGKFPDWRKTLVPAEHLKRGIPHALSGKYLALLNHPAIGQLRDSGIFFWGDDRGTDEKPAAITIRFESMPALVVLLMPIKIQAETSWPGWMPAKAPEAVSAA